MKVTLLKAPDSTDEFYGINLVAENAKDKQNIKKLVGSGFEVYFDEKINYGLKKKATVIQLTLIQPG